MDRETLLHQMLRWADRLGRSVVGLVFLAAAVPKLLDVRGFVQVVEAYGIVPDMLLWPVAAGLPIVEIFLALGLAYNHRPSKIASTLLLLFFILLLSFSIRQGLDIDCGCFGPEEPEYRAFHGLRSALVRDFVMLVPMAYSFWYHRYRSYSFKLNRR